MQCKRIDLNAIRLYLFITTESILIAITFDVYCYLSSSTTTNTEQTTDLTSTYEVEL